MADAAGGLFVDRNPDVMRFSRVRAQWCRQLKGEYLFVDVGFWDSEIFQSPLMKRAWACQERGHGFPSVAMSPQIVSQGETWYSRSSMSA